MDTTTERSQPVDFVDLTVIGGSSPATAILLLGLRRAIAEKRLPMMHVRLWGRDQSRLKGIRDYVNFMSGNLPQQEGAGESTMRLSCHASLAKALANASHILCQIRPGGMEARAAAERLAIKAGVPGDEGIGPGGLATFLRGRETMEDILRTCVTAAPSATFLQMTSPLGLMMGVTRNYYPQSSYGICELPATTLRRILLHVEERVGYGPLTPALAGLNHLSWFYDFRDRDGVDRTQDVLRAIDDPELVQTDPDVIRKLGAVPLHYLSLILHTKRHVERQRRADASRGEQLARWSVELHRAYCNKEGPLVERVTSLLAQRNIDWYQEGVIPALTAFLNVAPTVLPLNTQNTAAIPGIPNDAIVETWCLVSDGKVAPLKAPPLPRGPARMTAKLVAYENAVLALPKHPSPGAVCAVLAQHPLSRSRRLSDLGAAISAMAANS